jgi:hypothetical protein
MVIKIRTMVIHTKKIIMVRAGVSLQALIMGGMVTLTTITVMAIITRTLKNESIVLRFLVPS